MRQHCGILLLHLNEKSVSQNCHRHPEEDQFGCKTRQKTQAPCRVASIFNTVLRQNDSFQGEYSLTEGAQISRFLYFLQIVPAQCVDGRCPYVRQAERRDRHIL